jgi:hypothetical protein
MGGRFLEVPDETSSLIPASGVYVLSELQRFATGADQNNSSNSSVARVLTRSINPVTARLLVAALVLAWTYGLFTFAVAVGLRAKNRHDRVLKRL